MADAAMKCSTCGATDRALARLLRGRPAEPDLREALEQSIEERSGT